MMSFCRKSVHSFLGITNLNCSNNYSSFEPKSPTTTSPCKHGLGLITDGTGEDAYRSPPRIIESSVLKFLSSPPSPAVKGGVFLPKKYPGGIGFIDEVGGGVDGLMSCTESLGFESSDERTVDDLIELGTRVESSTSSSRAKWRKVGERRRRETKKFPPPLSSFNQHGQPSFFLRPMRKDGRLELTEVRIDRPEILRAYREDGRLRLHLIREDDDLDYTHEFKEEEQNYNQETQQHEQQNNQDQVDEEEEEEEEIVEKLMEEEKNHEEETVGEWKFPVTGEGFRRCNESMVAHDSHDYHHHHHHNMSHHHNLHVWGQHFVTTR